MKKFYRHILNFLLVLLSVTALAQGTTVTNSNGEITTSFSNTVIQEAEPNELITYNITFTSDIPDIEINGEFFRINFAEVMLQVHEVNESNINNPDDVPEQQLTFQSNMTQIFDGTSTGNFNIRMPSVLSSDLPTGKKYRLRMENTGIGTVNASIIPFELDVTFGSTLSDLEISKIDSNYLTSPNPTNGNVEFVKNIKKAQVFDIYGKRLSSLSNIKNIDLKEFSPGIYFITIQDNTINETLKIIKN